MRTTVHWKLSALIEFELGATLSMSPGPWCNALMVRVPIHSDKPHSNILKASSTVGTVPLSSRPRRLQDRPLPSR